MNLHINLLKDHLRRTHVRKETKRRHQLKWIIHAVNRSLHRPLYDPNSLKLLTAKVHSTLTYTKPNNSLTRINNRCRISGNSSSVSRFFRLSRQTLKEQIKYTQQFPGVTNLPLGKLKTKKLKLHAL